MHTPSAGLTVSIPGRGTKISHAAQYGLKINKKWGTVQAEHCLREPFLPEPLSLSQTPWPSLEAGDSEEAVRTLPPL